MDKRMGKTVNEIRKEFQEARNGNIKKDPQKEISEAYKNYLINNVANMANALGVTDDKIIECFKNEGFQDEETKRRRLLIDTAQLKAAYFRDYLLEKMAEWDKENPEEPFQTRINIMVTLEPKNHS